MANLLFLHNIIIGSENIRYFKTVRKNFNMGEKIQ